MLEAERNLAIRHHVRKFFAGHASEEHVWPLGPAQDELRRLRVMEFAPGPVIGLWVYVTVGAWEACDDPRIEFLIVTPEQDLRHNELLFMTAWYHRHHVLKCGDTFPIGESWLPGSRCEYFLVSLPYPFGPKLESCSFPDWHLHVRWLLPITTGEREFKVREGLEELEQRFETCGLLYWVHTRESVV